MIDVWAAIGTSAVFIVAGVGIGLLWIHGRTDSGDDDEWDVDDTAW